MATSVKKLRFVSFAHVGFAVLAVITGIAAMNVTDYYIGLFGMGIWLGGWILVTGLAGMATAMKPGNFCRVGVFLGCCLVAIVVLSICSIVVGFVVIRHFRFEATVTRDYYKDKGTFGRTSHEDYFKPDEYFEDRHKAGRVGLAVYSCLLVVILCDALLSAVSVYVCRDLTLTGQAAITGSSNRRVASTQQTQAATGVVPVAGQNWAEPVFPQAATLQPVHLIENSDFQYFTPCKLPNYAELYPEGIANPAVDTNAETPVSHFTYEPPPAYTPTVGASSLPLHTSLPGSPVVLSLSLHTSPGTEQTIAEESAVSTTTFTPSAERIRLERSLEGSNDSSEHPGATENPSGYPGSSTPVHFLHPGDLESTIPVSFTPTSLVTDLSDTAATINSQVTSTNTLVTSADSSARVIHSRAGSFSGSLPNSAEVDTAQNLHEPMPHHESQNGTASVFENAAVTVTAAVASETR